MLTVVVAACSASSSSKSEFGGDGGASSASDASSPSASSSSGIGGDLGFGGNSSGSGSGGGMPSCNSGPNDDFDKDGFTVAQGDCNDCDANVNPGAIEVLAVAGADGGVPMPSDEDCDGKVDNVVQACDDGIALTDTNAMNGAKAIDLCQTATANDKKWGVLSSKYVRADGGPWVQGPEVGILSDFGPNVHVQGGKRMLGVSSGHARIPGQPDACNDFSCTVAGPGNAPPGFPQDVPNCPGDQTINDDVGLEVKLRAPTNATGYSFLFKFYSFEYPEWVCTNFNDQFIALANPAPMGSINGNISFDSMNNPVSVNIAFFDVCAGCAKGTAELQGNGFDGSWNQDAGATTWLKTTAPIKGGQEFSVRFAIWDTGDFAWDSTALIDNFQWIANGGSVAIGTTPAPVPK